MLSIQLILKQCIVYSFSQDADTAFVSKPFCAHIDARLYSTAGNKCTADALVDLYTQMAAMEDTPMKRQFLKKVFFVST